MKRVVELFFQLKPMIILIIIPIAFTLIFGACMSPIFVNGIPIGILDLDRSDESRELIDDFRSSPTFIVLETVDSIDQLEDDIMTEKISGGIIFPEGFQSDITQRSGAQALVMIDGTNTLIGNNLKLYAYKIFMEKNYALQVADLEKNDLVPFVSNQYINTLSSADRVLYNPQQGYFYYLYAGLLGVFVQQTYLNVLAPMLLKEKERLKHQPLDRASRRIQARRLLPEILTYAGYTFISLIVCFILAKVLFGYPLHGNLLTTLITQVIFLVGLTGMALIFAAIFDDVTHCTQFVMFLTIPTMLSCGYSWPEFMMAPGFAFVMKRVWPLYYYYNPLKELMLKGATLSAISDYLIGGIIFAAFWLPVGMWIFRQKIRTMKQIEQL